MLNRLRVQNIALISMLDIEMNGGLNVITGETGAGKSIIIDSINLALGGRVGRDIIKYGESRACVEATFDITDNHAAIAVLNNEEIEAEDSITISRSISVTEGSANVKSVCRVNGTMVSAAVLKAITENIVDVHGQHEHQSLLSARRHIAFLDSFAREAVVQLKEKVARSYRAYKRVEAELNSGFVSGAEKERMVDMLTYQINEIEAANIEEGEDDAITAERDILENGEHIMKSLERVTSLMFGESRGAVHSIKEACDEFREISNMTPEYSEFFEKLNEAYYLLEDVAYTARGMRDDFSYDPHRLDEIGSRLDTINQLKRKYGRTITDILAFCAKAKIELAELVGSAEKRAGLQKELEQYEQEYIKYAEELSDKRKEAAAVFSESVMRELCDLGLAKARLSVHFERMSDTIASENGIDNIEFLLSANPGEPEKPLVKVASGGEISRIMLALKAVLSGCEGITTMIFDEIDTGISGNTAKVVGKKMQMLSCGKQVIAITHLPQIAACADAHYLVEKIEVGDGVQTSLRMLNADERVREVARIMGGEDSSLAIDHAKAMITEARS